MFKRKGEGGKGFLNNFKKKLHFSYPEASLSALCGIGYWVWSMSTL